MPRQRVNELPCIVGKLRVHRGIHDVEVAGRTGKAVELRTELAAAAEHAVMHVQGIGGGVPEVHRPRLPAIAGDRPERLHVDREQKFGRLRRRHRLLGEDLPADHGSATRLLEMQRDRLVEQVHVADGGVQPVARCALVAEQQARDPEVRHLPGLGHAQSEGTAAAALGARLEQPDDRITADRVVGACKHGRRQADLAQLRHRIEPELFRQCRIRPQYRCAHEPHDRRLPARRGRLRRTARARPIVVQCEGIVTKCITPRPGAD